MRLAKFVTLGVVCAVVTIVVVLLLITPASLPPQASPQIWAEYHSASGTHAYVVGYYTDFWNGWGASFNFQDTNGLWHGYYLTHESKRWRNVRIEPLDEKAKLRIWKGKQLVAEYSYPSNLFYYVGSKRQPPPREGVANLSPDLAKLFSEHQKK